MRALLKKELLEITWPAAVLITAMCWAWFHLAKLDDMLIVPNLARAALVVVGSVAWGSLIGYLQFAAERWHCPSKISREPLVMFDSQLMHPVVSLNEWRLPWM